MKIKPYIKNFFRQKYKHYKSNGIILINNVLINVLIMNSDIQGYSLRTVKTELSKLLKEIQN